MATEEVVKWLVYGLGSVLSLTLMTIGALIAYTVKNIKLSIHELKVSFNDLTTSLNKLTNKVAVGQAVAEEKFEINEVSVKELRSYFDAYCTKVNDELKFLHNKISENTLKVNKIESKFNGLEKLVERGL